MFFRFGDLEIGLFMIELVLSLFYRLLGKLFYLFLYFVEFRVLLGWDLVFYLF